MAKLAFFHAYIVPNITLSPSSDAINVNWSNTCMNDGVYYYGGSHTVSCNGTNVSFLSNETSGTVMVTDLEPYTSYDCCWTNDCQQIRTLAGNVLAITQTAC